MTAKTVMKELAMTCLESLQHQLIENSSVSFQLPECKMMAQVAVKQLMATEDKGFIKTCLVLIHHLLIEKRLVTLTLPESKIIGKAAFKQLSVKCDYSVAYNHLVLMHHYTYLVLIHHSLIEKRSVTFLLPELQIIGNVALKQLSDTKDNGLAQPCLALIQHVVKKDIDILVNIEVIKVVLVGFLHIKLRDDGQNKDDQVLHTNLAVAMDIIAHVLDEDINSRDTVKSCETFMDEGGVMLLQEYLQICPGKEDNITRIVKSLADLAAKYDGCSSEMMSQPVLSTLLWILNATMEAHFLVRYWSACTLCKLSGSYFWTVENPLHSQVMKAVTEAIASWPISVDPPQEYMSFGKVGEPLYCLAQGPSKYPDCQLVHQAWVIANATTHNAERYCPLLEIPRNWFGVIRKGTGVEVLQAITASSSYSDETKTMVNKVLQCYEDYNKTK